MEATATDQSKAIILRPMRTEERRFVIDSWARSFFAANRAKIPREIERWAWHRIHREGVQGLMQGAEVRIAVMREMPDEAMGWVCWSPPDDHPLTIHYVYVKPAVQRYGVGSLLLRAALGAADDRGVQKTHRTNEGSALWNAVISNA